MYIQEFSHEESSTRNAGLGLSANRSGNTGWLWESHYDFHGHYFHLHGGATDFPDRSQGALNGLRHRKQSMTFAGRTLREGRNKEETGFYRSSQPHFSSVFPLLLKDVLMATLWVITRNSLLGACPRSQQHYLQKPRSERNPRVHQPRDG